MKHDPASSNGRTSGSEPEDEGSTPSAGTISIDSIRKAAALILSGSAPLVEAVDVDTGEHFYADAVKRTWSQRRMYEAFYAGNPMLPMRRPFFPPGLTVDRRRR